MKAVHFEQIDKKDYDQRLDTIDHEDTIKYTSLYIIMIIYTHALTGATTWPSKHSSLPCLTDRIISPVQFFAYKCTINYLHRRSTNINRKPTCSMKSLASDITLKPA